MAAIFPLAPTCAEAVSLDQAKGQTIDQDATWRIAQRFNGATCPNVQPPSGNGALASGRALPADLLRSASEWHA